MVITEHNFDVIAAADWIVNLGPEGGKDGGAIVAERSPETIIAHHTISHTGGYLKQRLAEPPPPSAPFASPPSPPVGGASAACPSDGSEPP